MNILDKNYDSTIWARAREIPELKGALDALQESYNKYCIGDILSSKFSHFRLFQDVGDRNTYQKDFFRRQHRLFTCTAMALIYPENEEYLTLLQDTIFEICDMFAWALPAHMGPLDKINQFELDLDSCTMGMAMALIKRLLGDRLHPLIINRIDTEIDRRVVEPFLSQRWHWEFRENNWTTVCAGSVGCTLMLNRPDIFELVKDRINHDMQTYVDAYGDDGVCTEGAGYWGYGFGYYVAYADMLRSYSNGRDDLLAGEKIKSIATFYQKMILDENVVVTFGDCGLGGRITINAGLVYKFKSIFGDIYEFPPRNTMVYDVHYFPSFLDTFICYSDSYLDSKISRDCEHFMANQGWYVKRTPSYSLACRGGSNGESHNHNDVGSFIFAQGDKQVLCDIGGRPYTRQYFENEYRYTYLETSSRGHNVPIINGKYQVNIPNTRSYTTFENGVVSIDFKELYGQEELKKLIRHYKCGENAVDITDEFEIDGEGTFSERFVTYFEPKIGDGVIEIDNLIITFDGTKGVASYSVEERALELNEDGSIKVGSDVYCINLDVKMPCNSFAFTIEVK
ncbi:MAG: heparinase II/III family protein [Clostridia bacterium]|nr:heparinase II/III family protein [Clostridia bacterium]